MLLKSVNHFSKFTKYFWSNKNYFPIDYYFCPYQRPKNVEIIFQKSFNAETNEALLEMGIGPLQCLLGQWAYRFFSSSF
jgi:hypothetical protein